MAHVLNHNMVSCQSAATEAQRPKRSDRSAATEAQRPKRSDRSAATEAQRPKPGLMSQTNNQNVIHFFYYFPQKLIPFCFIFSHQ
jgi:sRNA-binding protein